MVERFNWKRTPRCRCQRHPAGDPSQQCQQIRLHDAREVHRCDSSHYGLPERARKRPAKLHADKGNDYKRCRAYLRRRGIASRIAKRGVQSSEKLGKHRWVVERTHGWFAGVGKLRIRVERRLDIHEALLKLAAADHLCTLRGSVVLAALKVNDPAHDQAN